MNMACNEAKETVLSECESDQANIVHSTFEKLLRAVTARSATKNLFEILRAPPISGYSRSRDLQESIQSLKISILR